MTSLTLSAIQLQNFFLFSLDHQTFKTHHLSHQHTLPDPSTPTLPSSRPSTSSTSPALLYSTTTPLLFIATTTTSKTTFTTQTTSTSTAKKSTVANVACRDRVLALPPTTTLNQNVFLHDVVTKMKMITYPMMTASTQENRTNP